MTNNIINDNILYLKEWYSLNPSLINKLYIEDNYLVLKENETSSKLDISNFYLPEMLYNENFRNKLISQYTPSDIFNIATVYVEAKEALNISNVLDSPKITSLEIQKDEENKEFLLITTEDNKKYRFDTTNQEKMINIYNEEKNKKGYVTINEFGGLIKNETNN